MRRRTRHAPGCARAVSGSDVLVGRRLYLEGVGDDEISFVGPTELQCLWFGPLRVCPQLFLFILVLPQVFQIECLHSCFCSFRNRHKNPKSRPPLTAHPCAKKAKEVVIAVRNELSTGPCEQRRRRKSQSFPSLLPKMPVSFDLPTEKGQGWKGRAQQSRPPLMDLLLLKLFGTTTCSPQRY